jgi:hypothetical protein
MRFITLLAVFSLISLGFSYNLTGVSDISSAKSNIALVLNHEAFLINPAFLHQTTFAISTQHLDTSGINTKEHGLNYLVYKGFGVGEMRRTELQGSKNITVALAGFGSQINRNFAWGITYQNISIENNGLLKNSWSTLLGLNYANFRNNLYFGLTLEHFFKDEQANLDDDLPPTIAFGFNLIPWNQVMWSNKLSFIRKEGEQVKYSSGLSLLINDNTMLNLGVNEANYTFGFDMPFMIENQAYLGSLRYAIEVPFKISDEIIYSLCYTWGK